MMNFGNYTSDVFRIWYHKRILCARKEKHEWAACTFAHPGERANRRDPRTHGPAMCQELEKTGECSLGDACPNAHSVFESWLHPLKYRTTMCSDAQTCTRNLCFFAHSQDELRTDTSMPAVPEGYDSMMSKHQSPGTSSSSSSSRHHHHNSNNHNSMHGSHPHVQRSAPGNTPVSAAHYSQRGNAGGSSSAGVAGQAAHSNLSQPPFLKQTHAHSAGQQVHGSGSDGGGSGSMQHQLLGRVVPGSAASPSAAAAATAAAHGMPGLYAMPMPMMMPVPGATYGAIPYAGAAGMPAAAVYLPGPSYTAPRSSSSSGSNSTQAASVQQQKMLQPLQRQGTGVYVPTALGLPGSSHAAAAWTDETAGMATSQQHRISSGPKPAEGAVVLAAVPASLSSIRHGRGRSSSSSSSPRCSGSRTRQQSKHMQLRHWGVRMRCMTQMRMPQQTISWAALRLTAVIIPGLYILHNTCSKQQPRQPPPSVLMAGRCCAPGQHAAACSRAACSWGRG
ncbi:hypothetical protein COO60DRAFT_663864 [Scenedesmus sp. NREL 46B-D3]|nr:hypothetical protein COO60DRAFT_663864 [Scenedesmus sp. NREL 46B-D3]